MFLLHSPGVTKLGVCLAAVVVAATSFGAGDAGAASPCSLPSRKTPWIDFADGSTPFWPMFAKPGNIVAASNFIFPPRIRARGAHTVYWDMYLNRRVGTPSNPKSPAEVVENANKIFDYAAASSGCTTPYIAENELFGSQLPTPWTPTNARYRENVLLYLRTLAARGARPYLLVSRPPYTAGEARQWWLEVAKVADFVREVYFPAPLIYRQGPVLGSRTLRRAFRKGIWDFTAMGISPRKLGLFLGFHTEPGTGGREGLKPAQAWFETIKWQALASKQVASELGFASIWSWGWANWGERGRDPDKPAAACVYLWTRDPRLCNGPAAAGRGFDKSKTEGQILLPSRIQCKLGRAAISRAAIAQLQAVTGDREAAFSALFARLVEVSEVRVSAREVLAAERAIVAGRFGGSMASYRAALARARATVAIARGVIADELRRGIIQSRLRVGQPSAGDVSLFYETHGDLLARPVTANPAPWWLGGRKTGFALSSVAPGQVFRIATGRRTVIRTMEGRVAVRASAEARPLRTLPLERVRGAVSAALTSFARRGAYTQWAIRRQTQALRSVVCARDELPEPASVDLTTSLPFLSRVG